MSKSTPHCLFAFLCFVVMTVGASPALAQRAEIFISGKAQFGVDLGAGGFDVVAH